MGRSFRTIERRAAEKAKRAHADNTIKNSYGIIARIARMQRGRRARLALIFASKSIFDYYTIDGRDFNKKRRKAGFT